MTIEEFAAAYRVKMTRGIYGSENLVLGKFGEIADSYRYGKGTLRLRLFAVPRSRGNMSKALNLRKEQARAAGMSPLHVTPHVSESIWGFDPADDAHCKLAIELVAPKRRRQYSEETRIAMCARLKMARLAQKPKQGTPLGTEKA